MKQHLHPFRGEVSVESVIYFPSVLLIVLCGFHLAALLHTTHVGNLAATRGSHAASSQLATFGNISMAVDEVNRVTGELGANAVRRPTISIEGKIVTVSVFLESPKIVPFLPTSVVKTASSAREIFMKEQER
ncbi:MAG: hypothetical protein RIR69_360 [Actinomycetota bacterium]|jgi:hypothetical protein